MRTRLPHLSTPLFLTAALLCQSPAEKGAVQPADDLARLAARVEAAHHPDGPVPAVRQFRAALEFHLTAPGAKQAGQVDLDVRYMSYRPEGRKRTVHLMRYRVERAGRPIERGRDRDGYWSLVQGRARPITRADAEDYAACRRDVRLARQLVRFLDPAAVLRELVDPTPVTEESLRFGRERGTPCLSVEGTLASFPLLRLAGGDTAVRARFYVDADTGRLIALRARPIVDGRPDDRQTEWIRLLDPVASQGRLIPKRIDHLYRDEKGRLFVQSKVRITALDLQPELALQDVERPR